MTGINLCSCSDLQSLLRSSSRFLNHATVGLVYFKHVTINFPNTWPKRSSVRRLSCSFEISDARFDLPGSKVQERPFTTQWRPCGKPREYIQLTSSYQAKLKDSTTKTFGNSGMYQLPGHLLVQDQESDSREALKFQNYYRENCTG
ncbi:hypothetical protein MRX96_008729 [Rhipicephalus microplus]